MSECRALTNMIGNSVAAIVAAKWEGQFDVERARRVLSQHEDDLTIPTEDDSALERSAAEPVAA
jgi:aerobic C4-dicarboxylate transport protein